MKQQLFIIAMGLITIPYAASISAAGTSLSDKQVKFTVPKTDFVVLKRGQVTAAVVNNQEVNDNTLPGHRAGYSGIASLTHAKHARNLFVPAYAGLNFEHIHDGTVQDRDVLFEPRRPAMALRQISEHVVELYQKPTPHWQLESCHRYALLPDGTIEMTFECIPRKRAFKENYIGLFWASYINQPESLDIHFMGKQTTAKSSATAQWIRGITPSHGTLSTHLAVDDRRHFKHDKAFPLTLVFNRSNHRYSEPWFFGVNRGMAFLQVFRPQDQVRITQSPSGGGKGNPAWDFQYLIRNYKVNQVYRFVMRAVYVPYESKEQIAKLAEHHLKELRRSTAESR